MPQLPQLHPPARSISDSHRAPRTSHAGGGAGGTTSESPTRPPRVSHGGSGGPTLRSGLGPGAGGQQDSAAAARLSALRQILTSQGVLPASSSSTSGSTAAGGTADVSPPPATAAASSTPVHERGVSLAWIKRFLAAMLKAGVPADASTEHMATRYLLPLLRSISKQHCLWEALSPEHYGKPEYYVVHPWQASFQGTLKAVCEQLDPPPLPDKPPPPFVDTSQVFVFLDFVCTPQAPGSGQGLLDAGSIREAITGAKGGALVVLDPDLLVFKRAWCLTECFLAAYTLPQEKLHVLFPDNLDLEMGPHLQALCSGVDITRAETTRPEDKVQIMREVKRQVGVQRMQQMTGDALGYSTRVALRWGTLERLAVYCALLLSKAEHGHVYLVLSLLPELQIEDLLLEEILQVFKLYDTDGSGELDAHEFVKALGAAGISEEEAMGMYQKCNADGGDGVSTEEFKQWWVDNNAGGGGSSKSQSNAEGLTVKDLQHSMEGFAKLLQRSGLEKCVGFFTDWCKQLEKTPATKLVVPPTKGDWKAMIENMNWKLANDDVKGAGQMLHTFLLGNAELLDVNPALLPAFDPALPRAEQYKPVHLYLEQLTSMLRWYPARKREMKMLADLARKYRLMSANAVDNHLPSVIKPKHVIRYAKQSDKLLFQIVSKMAHLKYGDRPVSKAVIEGAIKALARWMAQTRASENNYDSMCQFSSEYLASVDMDEYMAHPGALGSTEAAGDSFDYGPHVVVMTHEAAPMLAAESSAGAISVGDARAASPAPAASAGRGSVFLPPLPEAARPLRLAAGSSLSAPNLRGSRGARPPRDPLDGPSSPASPSAAGGLAELSALSPRAPGATRHTTGGRHDGAPRLQPPSMLSLSSMPARPPKEPTSPKSRVLSKLSSLYKNMLPVEKDDSPLMLLNSKPRPAKVGMSPANRAKSKADKSRGGKD